MTVWDTKIFLPGKNTSNLVTKAQFGYLSGLLGLQDKVELDGHQKIVILMRNEQNAICCGKNVEKNSIYIIISHISISMMLYKKRLGNWIKKLAKVGMNSKEWRT